MNNESPHYQNQIPWEEALKYLGVLFALICFVLPVQAQSNCKVLDSDIAGSYTGGCTEGCCRLLRETEQSPQNGHSQEIARLILSQPIFAIYPVY